MHKVILLFFGLISFKVGAQQIEQFYYLEPESKNLPVYVRGNLKSKTILLYVQGGLAENGIDFGRSDYPKWKNSLEEKVAIAYYDQRGLNRRIADIDTSKIKLLQVLKDILSIAKGLGDRYQAEVYLIGHSLGGQKILRSIALYPERAEKIAGLILLNTPFTTDFSPERYNYYRPLYLKNLALEKLAQGQDSLYWQEAYDWMTSRDSISSLGDSKIWNNYVDAAFKEQDRRINLGMLWSNLFVSPYSYFKVFYEKDNQFIADLLWEEEKDLWDHNKQTNNWELLPKVKRPVLLIGGRFDPIATPEELEQAQLLLPNSELHILPQSGHQSYISQAEKLNSLIMQFLKL